MSHQLIAYQCSDIVGNPATSSRSLPQFPTTHCIWQLDSCRNPANPPTISYQFFLGIEHSCKPTHSSS
ncbi:hypothetical protein PGT21_025560 [Puccinia graminis f. sp. tritici]|uniref:Uncharacterized protein n=1 Tax=Puccinia graminis f. sp. tritici TaxID=56615 RepID=A0A5B0MUJ2_PUCGR|nr:hypothetical protein PGT21_025560 [Puccinia graminis f. sp. tritici]